MPCRARRNAIVWPLYRTIIARLSCDCDTSTIECDTTAIVWYDSVGIENLSMQNALSCPKECMVLFSALLALHESLIYDMQKSLTRHAETDADHAAQGPE
jgi:hypothetical protein